MYYIIRFFGEPCILPFSSIAWQTEIVTTIDLPKASEFYFSFVKSRLCAFHFLIDEVIYKLFLSSISFSRMGNKVIKFYKKHMDWESLKRKKKLQDARAMAKG